MIDFGYYTFNGKKKKLSKEVVLNKHGGFDRRYKVNKGWEYHNKIDELYSQKLVDTLFKPLIFVSKFFFNEKISK